LPKINEEIEREYNTADKKKPESKIKSRAKKRKFNKDANSIDSCSSISSISQERYNEKW